MAAADEDESVASADMPTAQSSLDPGANAVREAARKRKRDDDDGDDDVGGGGEKKSAEDAATMRPPPPRTSCVHQVAIPECWDGDRDALNNPTYDGARAKAYPFVLDAFQETSIAVLERNESVMVAAHTSAGKTVVAEYAIAMAFRDKQRVIYTSPIKALSNQKFRELAEEFGGDAGAEVGLMTGDVCINKNATCIVMTTEVLRGMLYRGSEIVREVKWIIFDEVHYMRDKERGVVWEESIIHAPEGSKMVFLSATLPNSFQFAQWITRLHDHPCHVVYTDHRPTPLQHYAFPKGGSGLHLIVDDRGNFRDENYRALSNAIDDVEAKRKAGGKGGGRGGGGRGGGRGGGGRGGGGRGGGRGAGAGGDDAGGEDISKVMTMIKKKDMYPVICFSFSRRECEEHPKALKNVDFTNDEEKAHIRTIFNHALTQCMAEEDRDLDAVTKILPLLEKGVGIHHSGLLPIVKELVEILFGESLVKCLFATETFAMGLNMPAKTVVFTSTEKFDGTEMRLLAPGEYTQMSGRAGRRGKDDRGTCIIMVDKKLEKEQLRGVCLGTPQPLNSEFKLTYYSILNLLKRAEGVVNAEYVIERSFHQFQHAEAVPRHKARLVEIEEEMTAMTHEHEAGVKAYHDLRREISACEAEMRARIVSPENAMRFLKPGRMIRVKHDGLDFGWGVVVHVAADAAGNDHVVDTLLQCAPGASEGKLAPASRGGPPSRAIDPDATCEVLPVSLAECVHELSAIRVTLPDDLRLRKNSESVGLALNELHQRYADDAFPRIDPIADMGIDDDAFAATAARCEALEKKLAKTATFKALQKEKKGDEGGEETKRVALYEKRAKLEEEAATLRSKVRSLSAVGEFRKELKSRAKVLKRLGHVDDALVVKLKGRAACEIDTADELLVTELMFNGCFTRLDASQLVALCSMFMPVEKVKHYTTPEALTPAIEELTTAAREIATLQKECKLDIDVDEFVDSFKPVLCEVVFDWSKGARFDDVMKKTDLFEGTVIRALRRLDELMMELHRAACAVGDEALAKKFEEGAKSLRHGVVFATSLYL
jgi:ATP-dependent RNA helicase DOB1